MPQDVQRGREGSSMSFLKKLLGKASDPPARVRVCIECGMPVEKHADWGGISRTQQEMAAARQPDAD